MKTAFVTGATGLLGRNLVRALLDRGVHVYGLVRSMEKAQVQLQGLGPNLTLIQGDVTAPEAFSEEMAQSDVLFHTAAYFRESYQGGAHWDKLMKVNVEGTRTLLQVAYKAGLKKVVHTSSIAVLHGTPFQKIDESMRRDPDTTSDDYYRSKILADDVVREHLETHPDAWAVMILPGWMHGPGDMGPTSAGRFTLDYMTRSLPGLPPSTVSFVDARDVADVMITAVHKGTRGASYLAAGVPMSMKEVASVYQEVTGVRAPRRSVPVWLVMINAWMSEGFSRLTGRGVQLSLATARMLREERGQNNFDHTKSMKELDLTFRPIPETLEDEIAWFREQNMLS